MTADLFTRLAHRALGDGGLTMLPDLEPEPPGDEDVAESACGADTPLAPDVPRTADAMRPPAGRAVTDPVRPPAGHAVADPARTTPATPVAPPAVLLRVPEIRPDPVPPELAPDTPQPFLPADAAVAPIPLPVEVGRDDGPAAPGARQLRARPGILEPLPLPTTGAPAPPPDRQPAQAADPGTSVEVTVGRIEIRVRPPAQGDSAGSRRTAGPAPALTLEEYLRRRETSS